MKIKPLWGLVFVVIFVVIFFVPSYCINDLPDMSHAESVYLYNVELGKVMAEKNATKMVYPSSTVKIMTGLTAIEKLSGRLNEPVTVTEEMLKKSTGNNIKLKVGEIVTVNDLLYATICGGANDAASVLAYVCSGGIDEFVEEMNKKTELLGALNTHYTNVSGMHDPAMTTTACDTFIIAKEASENDLFVEMSSASKYVLPKTNMSEERNIYNKNYLISRYSETKYYNKYAKGLNSGFTTQGGYCLATCTESDGQTYICVVMGADEFDGNISSYTIANSLIDWAYSSYGYVTVLSAETLLCEIPVTLSEDVDYVTLHAKEDLRVFLPLSVDKEKDIVCTPKLTAPSLEAPVEEGQVAGFVNVEYNGELLGKIDLITSNRVERSEFLYTLKRLRDFSRQRVFIISVIVFVILLVAYIFGTAIYRAGYGQRRRRHHR